MECTETIDFFLVFPPDFCLLAFVLFRQLAKWLDQGIVDVLSGLTMRF